MPAKLEELEGVYRGEKFRFGECLIGAIDAGVVFSKPGEFSMDSWLTIKGDADVGELMVGQRYRFYGRFTTYKNKRNGTDEQQFHFQTFVTCQSHGRDGVIEYLTRAGKGYGLGRATAAKLWDAHGSDAVSKCREDPRRIIQAGRGITQSQAEAIAETLKSQKATEDATIDLIELLAGRGLPKTTARKAILKWGNRGAQVIRRDPYALMNFRGCGFKLADALWIELGHSPHRLRRQALCAWHSVASDSNGHIWFPAQQVASAVRQAVGGTKAQPVRAIKLATRLAKLSPDHYGALAAVRATDDGIVDEGGSLWLAEGKKAEAERELARMLAGAVGELQRDGGSLWPVASEIDGIDDHQREKLADALTSRVAILGGSPGTGKTYATAMLIKHLLREGIVGPDDIAIGCPTGKAAVRITEAMQAAGVNLHARTWHSLLGVGQSDDENGGWSFLHNESNPWHYRIIIGDESSMLDTALMRSVMAARPRGCHVLLVGDVNQLPPVGAGAPLRDMIASQCFGYGELTEIKRNSGGIVEACAAIRDGKPWTAGENLIVKGVSTAQQLPCVIETIREAAGEGYDPVWDCQVLVAVNARSPLSRKAVNQFLQVELNPNQEVKGTPFRIDDKIVCLKNGRFSLVDGEPESGDPESPTEVYVANGELARVVEIEAKYLVAELANPPRKIRIPRGKSEDTEGDGEGSSSGCSWDLAYGLSTHKSQGSEWPITIVIIDEYPGARQVCSREWLYTGLSRGKAKTIVVGRKATADAMCRRVAIGNRKTFLRELIQMKTTELAIEGMGI